MKTFRKHLKEELKNEDFRKYYEEESKLQELALKLNKIRQELGLSQKELAEKAHITQQQLSKLENGVNCNMLTFLKACKALKIDLELKI